MRGIVGPLRFVFVSHEEAVEQELIPPNAPTMTIIIAQDDEVTIQLTTPGDMPEAQRPNAMEIASVFAETKRQMMEHRPSTAAPCSAAPFGAPPAGL